MELLAVSAHFYLIHHDVLGCHERKLCSQMLLNDLRINLQSVRDIQAQIQDAIDGQEALRNRKSLVCRIIQRSFKPLGSGCNGRIQNIHHDVAGQRADTLRAHRIALVGHRRGADLCLLKRLLHLLEVLKKTNVRCHLHCRSRDTAERVQHKGIHLARVGLPGYRIAGSKAHLLCNHGIQTIHLLEIAVKQLQEGSLRSRGALAAKKLELGDCVIYFLQIKNKLIQPEACSLSDRRRLRRLEMCKAKRRLLLVLIRKICQSGNDIDQLLPDKKKGITHNDDIRIVSDIAAGCSQMDDALCLRAKKTVSINMTHDIVADNFLAGLRLFVIDILRVLLHLRNLLIGDIQSQLLLCLSECNPELSPGPEFLIRRKDILHLTARIPRGKRTYILIVCHTDLLSYITKQPVPPETTGTLPLTSEVSDAVPLHSLHPVPRSDSASANQLRACAPKH